MEEQREHHSANSTKDADRRLPGVWKMVHECSAATGAVPMLAVRRALPVGTADAATSKIRLPELPPWVVPRPRVMIRITKGVRGPLTVVTGPPGVGKTVAVTSWVQAQPDRDAIAWMTVDDGDRDPAVFWWYLLEALHQAGVPSPRTGRSPFRADGLDHRCVAELASVLSRRQDPVVLVLDDFGAVLDRRVVTGMSYLLALARPRLRLIVISRQEFPLPLHRRRLSGEVTEIRADDLAFSERETGQLMTRHGVALRRESVRALRERSEGWAAGLRLAAISLRGHPDPEKFIAHVTDGDGNIAGYLLEEVLDVQRPAVREVLLTTSILDRVSAEIAAELTPEICGTEFRKLAGDISFIRPLGNGWYRYHPMFRDVLRWRLRYEQPGRTAQLHLRAAAWFRDRGLDTEAVWHAAAAEQWRQACALVVERFGVGDLLGLRRVPALSAALRPMPAAVAWTELEPALVAAALALAVGDADSCRAALRRSAELLGQHSAELLGQHSAELLAGTSQDDAAAARSCAAVLRLVHARCFQEADIPAAAAQAQSLLDRLPDHLLEQRPEVRCVAISGRGIAEMWAGSAARAADLLAAAHRTAVEADSAFLRLDCLANGALSEAFRGRWGRAAELADQAAQLVPAQMSPLRRSVTALPVVRAWIALQRYQLPEARQMLDRAGPDLLEPEHPLMAAVCTLVSARIDSAEGQHNAALAALDRTLDGSSMPTWLVRSLLLTKAAVCTAAGAIVEAGDAALRAGGARAADSAVALARAQFAAGHPATALDILRATVAETAVLPSEVRIGAWLLEAQSSYAVGNSSRGRRSLDRALRLGDRDQLRLPFAVLAPWLNSVLRADQELARPYRRLLEPLRIGTGIQADPGGPTSPGPELFRQLSDRELEVLQHLAQMRTSEEIADQMYVSINTVKTHLKSIYRKLAVTRRGDAVRRAQQLELLVRTTGASGRSEQPQFACAPDGLGT